MMLMRFGWSALVLAFGGIVFVDDKTFLSGGVVFMQQASAEDPQDGELRLEVASSLEKHVGTHLRVVEDLGQLPAGRRVRVVMTASNPFDEPFFFDFIRPSCSCLDIKVTENKIPARGTIRVEFFLETPVKASNVLQTVGARFGLRGEPGIVLHCSLKYELIGLVSFTDKMVTVSTDGLSESVSWRIPFILAEPCRLEHMQATGSGAFAGILKSSFVREAGLCFLECTLPVKDLTSTGLSAEIGIKEAKTGREDSILCLVRREPEIEVAPSVLQFASVGSEKEDGHGRFEGTFLVRLRGKALESVAELSSDNIHATCRSVDDSEKIKFEINEKRIAKGVYRMTVFATISSEHHEVLREKKLDVELIVHAGTNSVEVPITVRFSKL